MPDFQSLAFLFMPATPQHRRNIIEQLAQTPTPRVDKCKGESFNLPGHTVGSVDLPVTFAWQNPGREQELQSIVDHTPNLVILKPRPVAGSSLSQGEMGRLCP
jgi:hypothetical protein